MKLALTCGANSVEANDRAASDFFARLPIVPAISSRAGSSELLNFNLPIWNFKDFLSYAIPGELHRSCTTRRSLYSS